MLRIYFIYKAELYERYNRYLWLKEKKRKNFLKGIEYFNCFMLNFCEFN